jgi:4-amino-4-deoxy-L-arabinose transferase-like glycosyltransferase
LRINKKFIFIVTIFFNLIKKLFFFTPHIFRLAVSPICWVFVHIFARLIVLYYAKSLEGDDGIRYLTEAANLLQFGIFSHELSNNPSPTAHDMPLFPFWLAALILLSDDIENAIFISAFFNCFFFGLTCWAIYLLSWRLFKKKSVCLFAVIVFGLFPETFPYTLYHMPDILCITFFTWSLLFLVLYFQILENKYLIFSSLFLGLAVMTKPIIIIFVFIFLSSILAWFFSQREILRGVKSSITLLILFSAVISPWIVRNFVTFGQVGISSISGSNLFNYNYKYLLQDKYPNEFEFLLNKKSDVILKGLSDEQKSNPMLISARLGSLAKEEILSNFTAYLETTLKRHPRLYIGTGTPALFALLGDNSAAAELKQFVSKDKNFYELSRRVQLVQSISWIVLAILYLASLFGVTCLVINKKWVQLLLLLGICCIFMAIIGPVTYTRYRFVLLPTLSILAAYGFSNFFYRHKQTEF